MSKQLLAGFARADLTPPNGIPLVGCGPAWERLSASVLDPVRVRILALRQGDEAAILLGFDTCFVGRQESATLKAAIGQRHGLTPAQILCAATHSHAGPAYDDYLDLEERPAPRDWIRLLNQRILAAVDEAWGSCQPVIMRAGRGRTTLPLNRRRQRDGGYVNAPNPCGSIYDTLPVIRFDAMDGQPVSVLFSISTHPVAVRGTGVSPDYPGQACQLLDEQLGTPCTIFFQGAAGDSRPRTLGEGREDWSWNSTVEDARAIGAILANEVTPLLDQLQPVTPKLRTALVDSQWPLAPLARETFEAIAAEGGARAAWARRQLQRLAWGDLPDHISILMQAIHFSEELRLVALEGEPLSPHAHAIEAAWASGLTIPIGYANGIGMYLVTTPILAEGGYEPESYWEYGQPGPLAPGLEAARDQALQALQFPT